MAEIKLDETYWIKSTKNSWDLCVERYIKNPKTGETEKGLLPISFHATVKSAAKEYLQKSLKDSDAKNLKELMAVADKCEKMIEASLSGLE